MRCLKKNIFRSFFLLILGGVTVGAGLGCAESQPLDDPPIKETQNAVFHDDYDEVWRAIQLALRKYPVRLNNIDSGILETDYIKDEKIFTDPVEGRFKPGTRYKITLKAVKGKKDGHPATKVFCTKAVETQADFFSGYQPKGSTGLEERVLLYRIGRFLEMEKILAKNAKHD